MSPTPSRPSTARSLPPVDLLGLRDGLDDAERARLEAIEEHLQTEVRPHLAPYWDAEEFPFDLLPGLAGLGLGGLLTDGSSALFQHLVHAEIARVDLSLSALVGIHNELNLGMIVALGSDEHRARWQGPLERFEAIGAFCLQAVSRRVVMVTAVERARLGMTTMTIFDGSGRQSRERRRRARRRASDGKPRVRISVSSSALWRGNMAMALPRSSTRGRSIFSTYGISDGVSG